MASLNRNLSEFGKILEETSIQTAYKGLIEFIKKVRLYFMEKYPDYDVSSNFYQGYMDLTFFSLSTKVTRQKDLKYMVVFNYEKMQFEVWLSGRNRKVMSKYHDEFGKYQFGDYILTPDKKGMSSIIQAVLVGNPDFDNLPELTKQIDAGVSCFIQEIENTFLINEESN